MRPTNNQAQYPPSVGYPYTQHQPTNISLSNVPSQHQLVNTSMHMLPKKQTNDLAASRKGLLGSGNHPQMSTSPPQFFKNQAAQIAANHPGNSMFKINTAQQSNVFSRLTQNPMVKTKASAALQNVSTSSNYQASNKVIGGQQKQYNNKDTPQSQVSHMSRITVQQKKQHSSKSQKVYDLTVKVLEANLFVSKTKIFQMSVYIKVKMDGQSEQRTSTQSGQNPKWDETFTFLNIKRKSSIEFSVYHKSLFSQEELIGNAIFIFDDMRTYNIKKVIVLSDQGLEVGSLHLNLSMKSRIIQSKPLDQPLIQNNNEDDIDDEVERSIDFRDHEVSRQIVTKGNSRNNKQDALHHNNTTGGVFFERNQLKQNNFTSTGGALGGGGSGSMNEQGTLQQYMANNNQQRQQTDSSIIHHYTNQSNQSFEEEAIAADSEQEEQVLHTHIVDGRKDSSIGYYKYQRDGTDPKQQNKGKVGASRNQIGIPNSRSHAVAQYPIEQEQIIPQQLFGGPQQQKHQMLYMEASAKGQKRRLSYDEDTYNQVPQETEDGGDLTAPLNLGEDEVDDFDRRLSQYQRAQMKLIILLKFI